MKGTVLVLDPKLPAETWELRPVKGKAKRSRKPMTKETYLSILEEAKVETLAVGESVHEDLQKILAKPGVKTELQLKLEKKEGKPHRPRRKPKTAGTALEDAQPGGPLWVDLSTNNGTDPSPPGTLDPGDAS